MVWRRIRRLEVNNSHICNLSSNCTQLHINYALCTLGTANTYCDAKELNSTIFIVITYYAFLLLVYTKPLTKPQTLKIPSSSEVLTNVLLKDLYNT